MDIIKGVCIFCTENHSVLSDNDKRIFLKLIKNVFFSTNRFNYTEFSKLFTEASVCISCAYKIDCCSQMRDSFKKGDTPKNKKSTSKCCSLCFKAHHLTNGTLQMKKQVAQFITDVHKRGSAPNVKYICLACWCSVSHWGTLVTSIWKILNNESADSEKENDHTDTVVAARTRGQTNAHKGTPAKSDSDDSLPSKTVDKRKKLSVRQANGESVAGEAAARKTRYASTMPSTSSRPVASEAKPKRSRTKDGSGETPGLLKKRRYSGAGLTPRTRQQAGHCHSAVGRQLQHLRTVDHETRSTAMNLSYSAVTDQRIMFDIPYIACTATSTAARANASEEHERKPRAGPRIGRPSRSSSAAAKRVVAVISVSSTDEETSEPGSRRRSSRKRKLTPKALLETGRRYQLRNAALKDAAKRFQCPQCGQQFATKYRRNLHKLEHAPSPKGGSVRIDGSAESDEAREQVGGTGDEQEDAPGESAEGAGAKNDEQSRAEEAGVADETAGMSVAEPAENVPVASHETQDTGSPAHKQEDKEPELEAPSTASAAAGEQIDPVEETVVEAKTELDTSSPQPPETQAEEEERTPGDEDQGTEESAAVVGLNEAAIVEVPVQDHVELGPAADDTEAADEPSSTETAASDELPANNNVPEGAEPTDDIAVGASDVQGKSEGGTEAAEAPPADATDEVTGDPAPDTVAEPIVESDNETDKKAAAQEAQVPAKEAEEEAMDTGASDVDGKVDTAAPEPSQQTNGIVAKKAVLAEKSDEEFATVEHFLENMGA